MSATLATLWLNDSAQLRLELLLGNNTQFRLELRRWEKAGHHTWRLPRKRGLRVERSELVRVLQALGGGGAA